MEWADSAVWANLPETESDEHQDELRTRLFHIHFTQLAFLGVWRGDDFKLRKAKDVDDTDEIRSEAIGFYTKVATLLHDLSEGDLSKPTPVPWAKFFARQLGREPEVTSLGETLLQVALHTQYHRGQINTLIRQLGGSPPMVDYIGWVWAGRPPADWSSDS